ncbi:MAG: Ca2+-binding RTX toxin-like protein [Halieaceae bacterium]
MEKAELTLEILQKASKVAAVVTDSLAERTAVTEFSLAGALDLKARYESGDTAINGIEADAPEGFQIHLMNILDNVNTQASIASQTIAGILARFEPINVAALELEEFLDAALEATGIQGLLDDLAAEIEGLAGDLLFGDDGDGVLRGGEGNDYLHGGNGGDTIDGGAGPNTATFNLYQINPKSGVARLTNDTGSISADLLAGTASGAEGNSTDNRITDSDGDGDNTLDGRFGWDTAVFSFALADATFGYEDGVFLVHYAGGTDRLLSIEPVEFSNQTLDFDELLELAYPRQHVGLFAGDRYETD